MIVFVATGVAILMCKTMATNIFGRNIVQIIDYIKVAKYQYSWGKCRKNRLNHKIQSVAAWCARRDLNPAIKKLKALEYKHFRVIHCRFRCHFSVFCRIMSNRNYGKICNSSLQYRQKKEIKL